MKTSYLFLSSAIAATMAGWARVRTAISMSGMNRLSLSVFGWIWSIASSMIILGSPWRRSMSRSTPDCAS